MKKLRTAKYLIGSLIVAAFFAGCDGEEVASSMESAPSHSYMLSCEEPETKANDYVANPLDDLYQHELKVNATSTLSNNDTPVAFVPSIEEGLSEDDAVSKKLSMEFDLAFLNIEELSSTQ